MLGWLFAAPPERRLIPGGWFEGPTAWVIAIMSFAIVLIAAAGLALANAAGIVAQGVEHRFAVQVPGGQTTLPSVLAAVRTAPGVTGADAVPAAEMRHTLEQWLGPAGVGADLPIPALINFDAAPGSDLADIGRRIVAADPSARLIAHRDSLRPLLRSIRALQWLALSLVVLMAAAAAATVVLAARGALDTHRGTIEVMHGIGATDLQVTHLFQRKVALDALSGSFIGAAAAGLLLAALFMAGSGLAGNLAGVAPLAGRDILLLALMPLSLSIIATSVARATVLAALRRAV